MISKKTKKVIASLMAVTMMAGSGMNVSAEVEMLSETSFDYKMLPWHTVESSPAKQNFYIEDGTLHISILKAVGSDREKWDLMTRYKNLSFKEGHTYTVSFKAKSNRKGLELCSNIGNVLGDKEYFVLNGDKMEHGPHMNGQWGRAAILTDKWQTFSGEFTPTEDLEGLIWEFEYADGTIYEGNAQDGDEIWFDDMSIVCQTCEPGDNCDVAHPDTHWGTNRDRSALVDPEKYAPDGKLVNYISVNQLGYYPKLSKIAVLSDNKGDILYHASTIDLTEDSYDFEICDAKTNEVKYEGKSGKAIKDEASGDTVYKLDFTEYDEPGTYYIKVGEWRSFDFRIAEDIYSENLLTDSINYFYQNRSGIDIESQYITSGNKDELAHAGGHKSDTAYVQKVWKNEYTGWQEIKETYTSSEITATGGWYDAGDHGKYVVNGGISVWTLQNMYERSVLSGEGKEKFSDGSGIVMVPEAGNDIPDILDEAAVELDWMTSMVVKEDEPTWGKYAGLVYHKLHDHRWTGLAVKPYIYEEEWGTLRIVKPPTFAATLNYVACTAQAARLWEPYDKEKADFYLEEAKKAYDAYLTHYYEADLAETVHPDFDIPCAKEEINEESLYAPKYHAKGGSPYGDYEVRDDAYWAACELYVTAKRMGDSSADKYYKELSEYKKAFEVPHKITGGENQKSGGSYTAFNWGNTATAGNMTLALNKDLISEEEYEKIKTSVVKTADEYISTEQSQGYGIPYLDDSPKYNDPFGYDYYNTIHGYEFASNSMVLNNAIVMAYAYELTEDPAYINGVTTAMDYLFGTNPLNFSFITGYGIYSGQKPYHKYWASEVDRSFPEAPDGVLLSGPNAYLDDPYIRSFGFDPYYNIPTQRCYMDSTESWSTNSAALEYNSSLAWVVSFLQDEATKTSCPDDPEPVQPAQIKYGDFNSDGVSDLSDLTLLSLHLIGDISVSDDMLKAADVYYDGEVNIADLAHFKQYICKEPDIVLGPQK